MKKKFLSILLVLTCLCLSFVLAACSNDEGGTTYEVTVKAGIGYTVQGINADGYKEGAEVAFTVAVADESKQIKKVSANDQALTVNADGYYKFTMPGKNVEISVVLEDKTPELSLSETSLVLNAKTAESVSVTATVTPDQDAHELEWRSDNENIATVTADGRTAQITAVAKGTANITVSFKGLDNAEAVEISVSVINVRPWTEAEETAMKEHLHGIVLYPAEQEDMRARWDAQYGQITIEGDWVEDDGLAEYAAQYTAEDGWVDVSYLYETEAGTAYMFEKEVEVSEEARYVRVFIYATTDATGSELATEGIFYITAYDPYVYEWPADYLSEALKDVLSIEVIPSVPAQHYYVSNYSVTAYYISTEEDGGYGAILEDAGYTVEKKEGYYSAVAPDEMFTLAYVYENGALQITIRYNMTSDWPQKAVANAFNYYQSVGATAFVLPVFEGNDVSFMFADGYYNKFWINEGRARDMYGTITVLESTPDLTNAYIQKLIDNGWVKVGNDGIYIKPIAESSQVHKITVTYSAQEESTLITIYYFSVKDPTSGWNDDTIKENNLFYKYNTDRLPEYTGEIIAFSADKDTVYITVPEEDFDDLMETYKTILLNAGYTLEGTTEWNKQYVSPNRQFSVRLSTPSSKPNTIQIYFNSEMPSKWNAKRIKESLQHIGSSLESIPTFESETSFLCLYEIKNDYSTGKDYLKITFSASDSSEKLSQDDFDAYKAMLEADGDWTPKTEGGNTFVGSDGKTTITISYSSYSGSITVEIKYVEA